MFKVLNQGWSLVAIALLLVSSSANAAPMLYSFDSGDAEMTVTVDDGQGTNALVGGGVVAVTLDGSQVVYDPLASTDGTLVSFAVTTAGPIIIDMDDANPDISTDTVVITNGILSSALGVTADVTSTGSFFIDTEMEAIIEGILSVPPGTPFGPDPTMALTSGASGNLGFGPGGEMILGLFGINIATFEQINDPGAPDLIVTANFTFIGTLVPEPGTALLLGLGLLGLGTTKRMR